VTHFPAPHSYTGEDVVEISAHGSPVVLHAIVAAAVAAGARLANPGEFTFRAYLHGRIDLVQAEAVAELIDAVTPLQARVAFDQLEGTLTTRLREIDAALLDLAARLEASLDFPEEGYHFITPAAAAQALTSVAASIDGVLADAARGRMLREGVTAAIVGRPNVGKSSLFNRLAGAARAIVTDVPGTTRDLLTERIDIGGVPFTFVDTAGMRREAGDAIEEEGIARARQAAAAADVVIVVVDRSRPVADDDRMLMHAPAHERILVASKSDLPPAWDAHEAGALPVSSLTDEGIADLRLRLTGACAGLADARDRPALANVRHTALLERARTSIDRARRSALDGVPEEFVLTDIHEARARFDEITGVRPHDEVLRTIFERFCIGK
jgi:tRNA modification GTPase